MNFVLTILFLLLTDLPQQAEHRLHLSEGVGNRLVKYRVGPKCPDGRCSRCRNAEVNLRLVVGRSGIVKQITVERATDPELAEAARDAVKQWRYERYIFQGTSVEYETHSTLRAWTCRT